MITDMKVKPDPNVVEKTVAVLQQRIRDDHDYLRRNETRTRVVLIDPLLRALGWDPEKSDEVHLEYKATNGKPDYALMNEGSPVAFVEAKRLGTRLETSDPGQVIKYTNDPALRQCEVVAFTDGNDWAFFRSPKWTLEAIEITSEQTFKTAHYLADYLSPTKLGRGVAKSTRRTNGTAPSRRSDKWFPLAGELPNALPTAVRYDDDAPLEWDSWRKLYTGVAQHLVSSGYIRMSDLPVWVANGKYCAINNEPVHPGPEGKPFGNPVQLGKGMWLEAYGNRNTLRDYSGRLLRKFHDDPESVQVRFD